MTSTCRYRRSGAIEKCDRQSRTACLSRSSPDEIHDLNPVAVVDQRVDEQMPLENRKVVLDGHAPRVDVEPGEQVGNRQRRIELEGLPVEGNAQMRGTARPLSVPRRSAAS